MNFQGKNSNPCWTGVKHSLTPSAKAAALFHQDFKNMYESLKKKRGDLKCQKQPLSLYNKFVTKWFKVTVSESLLQNPDLHPEEHLWVKKMCVSKTTFKRDSVPPVLSEGMDQTLYTRQWYQILRKCMETSDWKRVLCLFVVSNACGSLKSLSEEELRYCCLF